MPALEILGLPQSNYVWAVRMVCEEKGVPYELKPSARTRPRSMPSIRSARCRRCATAT